MNPNSSRLRRAGLLTGLAAAALLVFPAAASAKKPKNRPVYTEVVERAPAEDAHGNRYEDRRDDRRGARSERRVDRGHRGDQGHRNRGASRRGFAFVQQTRATLDRLNYRVSQAASYGTLDHRELRRLNRTASKVRSALRWARSDGHMSRHERARVEQLLQRYRRQLRRSIRA